MTTRLKTIFAEPETWFFIVAAAIAGVIAGFGVIGVMTVTDNPMLRWVGNMGSLLIAFLLLYVAGKTINKTCAKQRRKSRTIRIPDQELAIKSTNRVTAKMVLSWVFGWCCSNAVFYLSYYLWPEPIIKATAVAVLPITLGLGILAFFYKLCEANSGSDPMAYYEQYFTKDPTQLYVFEPDRFGPYTFCVLAKTEHEAREKITKYIGCTDLSDRGYDGWEEGLYTCKTYSQEEVHKYTYD